MGFKLEQHIQTPEQQLESNWISRTLQKEVTFFGKTFGNRKKEDFYTEIAVLLKAGITLRDALALVRENEKKEKMRSFYSEMVDALVSGTSFYEILQEQRPFTEYEYCSVKIGEETGTLPRITEELGKFFAQKNEQRRSLINALTYPIIILITAVLVVIFMLRMVVPMFEDIFKQNNVDLPAMTKMVVSASNFIRDFGWLVLLIGVGLIVLRKTLANTIAFKRRKDFLLLRIPYLGNFIASVYLAQFTQAVALLTASKVPVLNSIGLVKKMIDFYPLKQALTQVEKHVLLGKSLNESMSTTSIFDHKMVSLVKVAEETNQTEYIFERLNRQYAIEVQQKSKLLSTVMEPLIIVVIGIFVGVILVSMYLPMFKLSSVVG